MEAEQFLNNDLKGTHQVYDETGVILISGIEHSEVCRIMEEYHQAKLKLLDIPNVVDSKRRLVNWDNGYNQGYDDRDRGREKNTNLGVY